VIRCAAVDGIGKFQLLDISPVKVAARVAICRPAAVATSNMRKRIGADLVVTGVVRKISIPDSHLTIFVRDVHTGH